MSFARVPRMSRSELLWITGPLVGLPQRSEEQAISWATHPALRRILRAFEPTPPQSIRETLALTHRHLDTRAGRERQDSPAASWTDSQVAAVLGAADELGLVSTKSPQEVTYDTAVVLGGTVTAHQMRLAVLNGLRARGVRFKSVVAAAAERPLSTAECLQTDGKVATEAAHLRGLLLSEMRAQVVSSLRKPSRSEGDYSGWSDERAMGEGCELALFSAPTGLAGRRPNTLDALTFAAKRLPEGLGRCLVITSAIYAPYTYFASLIELQSRRIATYMELIGSTTQAGKDPARQAQLFGQEVHATVQAIGNMLRV